MIEKIIVLEEVWEDDSATLVIEVFIPLRNRVWRAAEQCQPNRHFLPWKLLRMMARWIDELNIKIGIFSENDKSRYHNYVVRIIMSELIYRFH